MSNFQPLIICESEAGALKCEDVFEQTFERGWSQGILNKEQLLENIVFQIITDPKALCVHVQRIYFCYQENLAEDLFAALVDLLLVLQGKGRDLSLRMVVGAKTRLIAADYAKLKQALSFSVAQMDLLNGNKYSLFSAGLIGTNVLIIKKHAELPEYDPLQIARDFVAYSQFDAALETLEKALLADKQRLPLHHDLLELYKVTDDRDRFFKMYAKLCSDMTAMPVGWDELKGFFNEG